MHLPILHTTCRRLYFPSDYLNRVTTTTTDQPTSSSPTQAATDQTGFYVQSKTENRSLIHTNFEK